MGDLLATTTMGTNTPLTAETVDAFKGSLGGALLGPSDAGYEDARKIWNGMIDKRPALIARCTGVADVMQAIQFARTHNLLVAVRGGSHNVAGYSTCDGGLVIDLSPMKGIWVDPARRTVRAQGGITWGELDRETQAFGLATTGGTDPTTGIAGLTLGGGMGWLQGKYGLAVDNLLAADVVTADGRFLTTSTREHVDLFWGLHHDPPGHACAPLPAVVSPGRGAPSRRNTPRTTCRVGRRDALKSSAWSQRASIGARASNRICPGCGGNRTPPRS